ncbi:unnamed protein product, partial [Tilletia controversa]
LGPKPQLSSSFPQLPQVPAIMVHTSRSLCRIAARRRRTARSRCFGIQTTVSPMRSTVSRFYLNFPAFLTRCSHAGT